MNDIPEGFGPMPRTSSFLDLVGPLHCRPEGAGLLLGIRVETRHANSRGIAHGGLLTTLADLALGYNCARMLGPDRHLATVSITIDFAAVASIGDWLLARCDVQQTGRRLAFANCYLSVEQRRIARASGIFSVIDRERPVSADAMPAPAAG